MGDSSEISHSVDLYVGEQLKKRRKVLNMSQSVLGEAVSLSLQQIQKYEQGVNRISAGKLFELSRELRVPITYFYEGIRLEENQEDSEKKNRISIARNKSLVMLLVEDSAADEVLTRNALDLCKETTEVFAVHDGAEALHFLKYKKSASSAPRPDIILLDINIPKIDGMSVLKEIKRDREIKDIPVIMLTNSINRQEMIDAYGLGASGFLCKAFDLDEFNKTMDVVVNYWSSAVILPSM